MRVPTLLVLLAGLPSALADPTWPNAIDELEEIAFQLFSTNARKFADNVSPCTDTPFGPGRVAAAEWLRTAFHDMATGNAYTGVGGLDGSIQFELGNSDNTGIGFKSTLQWMSPFLSKKTSMADLIALGSYAAVRSCGGPKTDISYGRVDATSGIGSGIPQIQNAISIFRTQFLRMGFNATEMIGLVACGHTLGGVHSANTPSAAPSGKYTDDVAVFDSTPAAFDNKIVTDYLANTTNNSLVIGPYLQSNWRSDLTVFKSDNNVTMKKLADATVFQSTCKDLLSRMVQLVPTGVTLSSPIKPYVVKPYRVALSLDSGGTTMTLGGYIRVHTTTIAKTDITNLKVDYKKRDGSVGGSYLSNIQGYGTGFDDEFGYFPLAVSIPTSTGISSFTVTINLTNGTSLLFNNNGNSYPIQDLAFLQPLQSCLLQGTGAFTPVVAVHNSLVSPDVSTQITYKLARPSTGTNPVPQLLSMNVSLAQGTCVGDYTLYTGNATVPGDLTAEMTFDVVATAAGVTYTDGFRRGRDLGGTCRAFSGTSCKGGSSTTVVSTTSTTTTGVDSTTVVPGTTTAVNSTTVIPTTSTISSTTVTSTATSVPTPTHNSTISGFTFLGCYTEGTNTRALSATSTTSANMTLSLCSTFCSSYSYFGTEYASECYCGNTLSSTSTEVSVSDCNMPCAGDATEYCGAGNRLELYKTTADIPTPTGVLSRKETVSAEWTRLGCYTEATNSRALSASTTADDEMTLESCATYCAEYEFFGTEYGRECYCGDVLGEGSEEAVDNDCGMVCAGDEFEYCGGSNRLEVYEKGVSNGTTTSTGGVFVESSTSSIASTTSTTVPATSTISDTSSTIVTTATSTATLTTSTDSSPQTPTISPTWSTYACLSEPTTTRALTALATSAPNMTLSLCATYCSNHVYFGTEYSTECYCGDTISPGALNVSTTDCTMSCGGNSDEFCGGASRLTVYKGSYNGPVLPETVGNWTLVGCVTEGDGVRALSSATTATDDMSLESCAEFCAEYALFGTEYGRECYCGDTLASTSSTVDLSECSMVCSGDSTEYCGASNRLSLYEKS